MISFACIFFVKLAREPQKSVISHDRYISRSVAIRANVFLFDFPRTRRRRALCLKVSLWFLSDRNNRQDKRKPDKLHVYSIFWFLSFDRDKLQRIFFSDSHRGGTKTWRNNKRHVPWGMEDFQDDLGLFRQRRLRWIDRAVERRNLKRNSVDISDTAVAFPRSFISNILLTEHRLRVPSITGCLFNRRC